MLPDAAAPTNRLREYFVDSRTRRRATSAAQTIVRAGSVVRLILRRECWPLVRAT